jgi:hypothetical protein
MKYIIYGRPSNDDMLSGSPFLPTVSAVLDESGKEAKKNWYDFCYRYKRLFSPPFQ